jgi:hypothetical protein
VPKSYSRNSTPIFFEAKNHRQNVALAAANSSPKKRGPRLQTKRLRLRIITVTIAVNLDRLSSRILPDFCYIRSGRVGGVFPAVEDSVSQQAEGAGLPTEFKEKRSFDDILWNTFIVGMVIFLGYALLLPRIRHVVAKIQSKKTTVMAKDASPPAGSQAGTTSPGPVAAIPAANEAPAASSTADAGSPASETPAPASPAPPAEKPPASSAPHVIVNPPPKASPAVAPKPAPTPKKPLATAKPPVEAGPFHARYLLEAGSYEISSNAEGLVSRLPREYQAHTTVTPVRVRGKLFYRVRILVATEAEANALAAHLIQREKVHPRISSLS